MHAARGRAAPFGDPGSADGGDRASWRLDRAAIGCFTCTRPGHFLAGQRVIIAGRNALDGIFESYCDQIEQLIGDANYRDAMSALQDFVRDFCPAKKGIVLALRSRYSRWRNDHSQGLPESDNINVIVKSCLELVDDIRSEAIPAPARGQQMPEEQPLGIGAFGPGTETPPDPAGAAPEPQADRPTLDQSRKRYFAERLRTGNALRQFVVFQGRDLVRGYKRGFRLGPISLELRAGEITALVGRNASGKTTFLRLCTGELKPDSGSLSYPALQKPESSWLDIKEKIAFVPQLPDRWHGRLRNTLNYVAATYGVRGAANRDLVDWHVARYGLTEYENATWDEISGGYKIRFELVRAMVSQPKILVLDEPLAYLDIIARQRFLSDLRSIASSLENPVPILVASQHLYEIEAIADQLVILDDGKCVFADYLDSVGQDGKRTVFEVSLKATKPDVKGFLEPFGLTGIEETTEGYILVFPQDVRHEAVFSALRGRFGEAFYAFRDISRSTRSLMTEDPKLAAALGQPASAEAVQ